MPDDPTRPTEDADARMDARLRLAGERWRARDGDVEPSVAGDDYDVEVARHETARPGRRRRFATIAAAAAAVAVLGVAVPLALRGGDHGGPAGSSTPLRGTVWRLMGQGSGGPSETSTATLSISASGALTADDECTLIGATVSNTETSIDVTKQIVRYKSCTDQYGVRLSSAVDVLTGEQPYSIASNDLTIGSGAQALHFTALPSGFPAPTLDTPTFIGATWRLISAENAAGLPVRFDGNLDLTISDNDRYTARTTCNATSGRATLDGSQVTFNEKHFPSSGPYCGQSPFPVGPEVLSGRVQQTVVGNKLTITKPGVGTLVYRWVPHDATSTAADALLTKQWKLVFVDGATVGSPLELYVGGQGGAWSAQNGCGFIGGTPTVSSGSVSFGRVEGSDCGGSAKALSEQIRSAFAGADLFRVEGDTLTLFGDTGQAGGLVYVRASGADATAAPSHDPTTGTVSSPPPLMGTTWILDPTSVGGKLGSEKPVTAHLRLMIENNGSFATNGCDPSAGTAVVRGNRIAFEQSGGSACSLVAGYSAREDDALAAMSTGSVTWSITDGRLRLTKGSTTLVFDPS